MTSNEISFVDSRRTIPEINRKSNVLADKDKVRKLLGLCLLQCVMRGLRVVVIVVKYERI